MGIIEINSCKISNLFKIIIRINDYLSNNDKLPQLKCKTKLHNGKAKHLETILTTTNINSRILTNIHSRINSNSNFTTRTKKSKTFHRIKIIMDSMDLIMDLISNSFNHSSNSSLNNKIMFNNNHTNKSLILRDYSK